MRDTLTPLLSDPARPAGGRRLRLLFGVVLAVLAMVALLVPPAAVGNSAAAEEWPWDVHPGPDSDLFPLVGEIQFRGSDGELLSGSPSRVGLDSELGLAVYVKNREIFLVDTRTLEPTVIPDPGGEHVIGENISGGDTAAYVDTENHRLIMTGSTDGEAPGEFVHECRTPTLVASRVCDTAPRGQEFAVTVVDLRGQADPVTRPMNLTHSESAELDEQLRVDLRVPFDYHPATDNLYLATQAEHTRPVLHEVPLESGSDGEDVQLEATWSYSLGACATVSENGGGAVVRSRRADFVYVACEGGETTPHGIQRVDLIPGQDASDTSNFRTSFDPFVGDIGQGKVSVDRANDLVLISIVLFGQRFFVYDVYRQAWTGSLELGNSNLLPATTNPETGRIYAFGSDSGLLRVTEGSWPAVPNSVGRRSDHDLGIRGIAGRTEPLFDPSTRRLFVNEAPMCVEEASDGTCAERKSAHYRVFEDRLPDLATPAVHPEYDARTSDLPEEPGVATSTASANAKAFGARHLWVGGTATAIHVHKAVTNAIGDEVRSAPAGSGTRDTIRAQVLNSNLSRISSPTTGALAAGLHIADEQTGQDLQRNTDVRCAPSRTASKFEREADCLSNDWQREEPGEGEPDQIHTVERELHRRWDGSSWPEEYPAEMQNRSAYCDDFGSEPSEDAMPGSAVACDSGVPHVSAGALFSPTQGDVSADGGTPGMHVGYAESSTDIREDEALGMVATASAVARDVDLSGQVSIGEIRTEATAVARGRPGTASTRLVREYRQVRIGDFACGWQDDNPCDLYEVAYQINAQLGPRVVARVPAQDTFLNPDAGDEPDAQTGEARVSNGTPGGAKALVTLDPYAYQSGASVNNDTRSELPGLEITVYHDNDQTSRQILQLAAVELDVGYRISPVPTWDPPDWGSGEGTGGDNGLGLDGGLSDPVGGATARSIVPPPPFAHLSQDPPPTTPADDSPGATGDTGQGTGEVGGFEDSDTTVSQGQAPSLGTAGGPAVSTGDGVPAPEIAPDASGEQPAVAQGEQSGSSGPGGLMLTRQRMGETVPLAVLWVLAALPFYLAARRRRLTASSLRT